MFEFALYIDITYHDFGDDLIFEMFPHYDPCYAYCLSFFKGNQITTQKVLNNF